MLNKNNNLKSFTMVETLVSIALFGFISVILVNIFLSSIKTQARILQSQELMDQSSYTLEYMGKLLRMAKKDTGGSCAGRAGANYGVGTDSITFLAYDTKEEEYRCRQFLLEDDVIKEKRSSDGSSANLGSAQAITSSKVKVEGVTFAVTGDGVSDAIQPKVTVMIDMESDISVNPPEIFIQTSVSQRQLDID
jgi:hypothetical protein